MPHEFSHAIWRIVLAMPVVASVFVGSALLASGDHAKAPSNLAPIDDALAAVQLIHPGRILKVELESVDGAVDAWVYEVKLLTRVGHVLEIKLDARSLEVIGLEGRRSRQTDDD